jgi:hypothetical protein
MSAVAMVPEMYKQLLGNPYLKYVATPLLSVGRAVVPIYEEGKND